MPRWQRGWASSRPTARRASSQSERLAHQVKSVGDGNPLLSVTCCGKTEDVTDAAIAQLSAIADNIFELDLARSQVGDGGCLEIAKMKRLTKLDLRQSAVSNAGLKHLAAIKTLRKVYIYPTKVTDGAVDQLKAAVPGLVVVY